jgi:NAD-dependent histone deacetylase SIR2
MSKASDALLNFISTRSSLLIVTGAGLSVSAGIPDFRSPTGLYANLDCESMGMSCPEDLFDLSFFTEEPSVFWGWSKAIYDTENIVPTKGHTFLKYLEDNNKLLRVYTQNVDGLEKKSGVSTDRIIYCHGNTENVVCLRCKHVVDGVKNDGYIMDCVGNGVVPLCKEECRSNKAPRIEGSRRSSRNTNTTTTAAATTTTTTTATLDPGLCNGTLKPSITFFGEPPSSFVTKQLTLDKKVCDGVIVIGTSLAVAPMSSVMKFINGVERVLINRNDVNVVSGGGKFELKLLGDIDCVVDRVMGGDEVGVEVDDGVWVYQNGVYKPHVKSDEGELNSAELKDTAYDKEGITCDECNVDMKEDVWTCEDCFGYDLCIDCLKVTKHFDGEHKFIKE